MIGSFPRLYAPIDASLQATNRVTQAANRIRRYLPWFVAGLLAISAACISFQAPSVGMEDAAVQTFSPIGNGTTQQPRFLPAVSSRILDATPTCDSSCIYYECGSELILLHEHD